MVLSKKSTSDKDKLEKDKVFLNWEAPEFIDHDKNFTWYLIAGLVLFAFIAYFIFAKEWISALTFFVLGIVGYRILKIKPKSIKYSISKLGISVGDKFYPYNELHSFWIVYLPNAKSPVKTLNIQSTKKYLPLITIQLKGLDLITIKSLLKKYLPEQEKRGENFMDKFVRILRF